MAHDKIGVFDSDIRDFMNRGKNLLDVERRLKFVQAAFPFDQSAHGDQVKDERKMMEEANGQRPG